MTLFNPSDQLVAFLTLCVTVLLPVLVGLVTKASTSGSVKAVLLAALSAVTGVSSALIQANDSGQGVDLYPLALSAVSVFVVAVATHYGLWKPTEVSAAAQSALVKD
jgi:hypothetical protein